MNRNEISPELLEDVKNYLSITWEETSTNQRVKGLIASAAQYLDEKSGGVLDYSVDGLARTLLMEYVRYGRDEALEVFENNYSALLLGLRHKRLVMEYAQDAGQE